MWYKDLAVSPSYLNLLGSNSGALRISVREIVRHSLKWRELFVATADVAV